jgi:hypothetical protein
MKPTNQDTSNQREKKITRITVGFMKICHQINQQHFGYFTTLSPLKLAQKKKENRTA